jgi:SAM-dependent methyltransferase
VQKLIDAQWRAEAELIYAGYELYHQSKSLSEQKSFDPHSGFGQPRSRVILEALSDQMDYSIEGRMLDFGCGVGVTLKAFHDLAPSWSLEGYDPNLKSHEALAAIDGVVGVHGDLGALESGFDCITCFHVLEHIVDPFAALNVVRALLAENGLLIIQVPYYEDNPFDLIIADHCSHFSPRTLRRLMERAGFETLECASSVVRRELTLIARPNSAGDLGLGAVRSPASPASDVDVVAEHGKLTDMVRWLSQVLNLGERPHVDGILGLFGTSIAGTFVGHHLGSRISFFVDEDASRIGSQHLGIPILAPDDMRPDASLLIPLMPEIAVPIAERIGSSYGRCILPPPWPRTDPDV